MLGHVKVLLTWTKEKHTVDTTQRGIFFSQTFTLHTVRFVSGWHYCIKCFNFYMTYKNENLLTMSQSRKKRKCFTLKVNFWQLSSSIDPQHTKRGFEHQSDKGEGQEYDPETHAGVSPLAGESWNQCPVPVTGIARVPFYFSSTLGRKSIAGATWSAKEPDWRYWWPDNGE